MTAIDPDLAALRDAYARTYRRMAQHYGRQGALDRINGHHRETLIDLGKWYALGRHS